MERKRHPILAVRAIILNEDNRILILKRTVSSEYGDLWCLPGGKIDFGQTATKAISREVKEETSLICTAVKFLFYLDSLPQNLDQDHYLTLYFQCRVKGKIKLNRESSEFTWIVPKQINKYDIAFDNDNAIKKYWEENK
jgi:mutator protein MutT